MTRKDHDQESHDLAESRPGNAMARKSQDQLITWLGTATTRKYQGQEEPRPGNVMTRKGYGQEMS